MADPFVAEIRIFPFNFAPKGWAFCDGQLLPLNQNTALFSLLGTTYGGDGKSNFALPNLQDCAPLAPDTGGSSTGLSQRFLGETGGAMTVALIENEMPSHSHAVWGAGGSGQASPASHSFGSAGLGRPPVYAASGSVAMSPQAVAPAGGDQPHNNLMPYLVFSFCIALQGVFPPRP